MREKKNDDEDEVAFRTRHGREQRGILFFLLSQETFKKGEEVVVNEAECLKSVQIHFSHEE